MSRRLSLLRNSSMLSTTGRSVISTRQPDRAEINSIFQRAIEAQEAGALETARQLNQSILAIDPCHAGALFCIALAEGKKEAPDFLSTSLIKAIVVQPAIGVVVLKLGIVAAARGLASAERWLKRSCNLAPHTPEPFEQLGIFYLGRKLYGEAYNFFCRTIVLDPAWSSGWNNWGTALSRANMTRSALPFFLRALKVHRTDGEIWSNIGKALLELGDIQEAEVAFEQAIAYAPSDPAHYRLLGEVHKFAVQDPFFVALCGISEANALTNEGRIELAFALAKAYTDIGQHEQAFEHLKEGNRLKRLSIAYDEQAVLNEMSKTHTHFDQTMRMRFAGAGFSDWDPIFILGMPRSGSTLVEKILSGHPQVRAAGEIDIFGTLLVEQFGPNYSAKAREAEPAVWGSLGEEYCRLMRDDANLDQRITDKLPINFRYLGYIHLALPRARIIHTRRSALDTCVSCFATPFVYDQPFSWDLGELGRYWAAYTALMRHWRQVLPAGAFLDIDYEMLVDDPEFQTQRLLEFCQLSWNDGCRKFHETPGSVRTASWAQVRRPIYRSSIGRADLYDRQLDPLRAALSGDDRCLIAETID